MIYLPNGIGEPLGDSLVTNEPLLLSGDVWWVDSQTGTDAASPAGRNREKPLATLAQALVNAANQDIIVCKSGHSETVNSTFNISKKVIIVGAGSSAGLPTVKFTMDSASNALFNITTDHVELRNLWLEENAQANSVQKINVDTTGPDFKMIGCYLEANENDDDALLFIDSGAHRVTLENCTFISTSTTTTTQPHSAIIIGGNISDLHMKGCVISDGTVGWSNIWAFDSSAAVLTAFRGEDMSLLLGAEMLFDASSTGFVAPTTQTGGAKVSW